jgi:hypothetical protein
MRPVADGEILQPTMPIEANASRAQSTHRKGSMKKFLVTEGE